jgi:hypothetical protein
MEELLGSEGCTAPLNDSLIRCDMEGRITTPPTTTGGRKEQSEHNKETKQSEVKQSKPNSSQTRLQQCLPQHVLQLISCMFAEPRAPKQCLGRNQNHDLMEPGHEQTGKDDQALHGIPALGRNRTTMPHTSGKANKNEVAAREMTCGTAKPCIGGA